MKSRVRINFYGIRVWRLSRISNVILAARLGSYWKSSLFFRFSTSVSTVLYTRTYTYTVYINNVYKIYCGSKFWLRVLESCIISQSLVQKIVTWRFNLHTLQRHAGISILILHDQIYYYNKHFDLSPSFKTCMTFLLFLMAGRVWDVGIKTIAYCSICNCCSCCFQAILVCSVTFFIIILRVQCEIFLGTPVRRRLVVIPWTFHQHIWNQMFRVFTMPLLYTFRCCLIIMLSLKTFGSSFTLTVTALL